VGSAKDMASLDEAFTMEVKLFNEPNNMIDNISHIEEPLDKSIERSDEQLSYFVPLTREIIDHSRLSQQDFLTNYVS
jgi:hypothetical protein